MTMIAGDQIFMEDGPVYKFQTGLIEGRRENKAVIMSTASTMGDGTRVPPGVRRDRQDCKTRPWRVPT